MEPGRLIVVPGRGAAEPGRLAAEPGRWTAELGRLEAEPGLVAEPGPGRWAAELGRLDMLRQMGEGKAQVAVDFCWSTLPKFGMFHGVYQLEGPRPRVGYRQGHETGCFYPLRTRMHHTHAGYALE